MGTNYISPPERLDESTDVRHENRLLFKCATLHGGRVSASPPERLQESAYKDTGKRRLPARWNLTTGEICPGVLRQVQRELDSRPIFHIFCHHSQKSSPPILTSIWLHRRDIVIISTRHYRIAAGAATGIRLRRYRREAQTGHMEPHRENNPPRGFPAGPKVSGPAKVP